MMSTFRDGSGQYGAGAWPGWRDFERVIAEALNAFAPEDKGIFDIYVRSTQDENTDYGISIKSKQLDRASALEDLEAEGRVHMELCNSPAKLWGSLTKLELEEADFRAQRHARRIGEAVIQEVRRWHCEAATNHPSMFPGRVLSPENSIYLVISYGKIRNAVRDYQIHSFTLELPQITEWRFVSPRCLRGFDPHFPDRVLIEWYGLSGGQLKYYPLARNSKYQSPRFQLSRPEPLTLASKARGCFHEQWEATQN